MVTVFSLNLLAPVFLLVVGSLVSCTRTVEFSIEFYERLFNCGLIFLTWELEYYINCRVSTLILVQLVIVVADGAGIHQNDKLIVLKHCSLSMLS